MNLKSVTDLVAGLVLLPNPMDNILGPNRYQPRLVSAMQVSATPTILDYPVDSTAINSDVLLPYITARNAQSVEHWGVWQATERLKKEFSTLWFGHIAYPVPRIKFMIAAVSPDSEQLKDRTQAQTTQIIEWQYASLGQVIGNTLAYLDYEIGLVYMQSDAELSMNYIFRYPKADSLPETMPMDLRKRLLDGFSKRVHAIEYRQGEGEIFRQALTDFLLS